MPPEPVVLRPEAIDEYGDVRSQIEALEPRAALLKKEIMACLPPELEAASVWSFQGERYVIGVSVCAWERTITSMRKLCRRVGWTNFFNCCKFSLSIFDGLVPEGERANFVTRTQDGARRLTIVKKFGS